MNLKITVADNRASSNLVLARKDAFPGDDSILHVNLSFRHLGDCRFMGHHDDRATFGIELQQHFLCRVLARIHLDELREGLHALLLDLKDV